MNPHLLSLGLLRHVGALALADMSASGKAATCRRSPKACWLLLSLLLLLTGGLRAEFEPPLIKVMEKDDIPKINHPQSSFINPSARRV